jgi:raffinose/stachyose/melibiose transport system substrate-binding protein
MEFIRGLNDGSRTIAGNRYLEDLEDLLKLTLTYGDKNPLTTDHNLQVQLLANGKAAMIQQGVWKEIPIYEANPEANLGLLPMPLNNDAERMNRIAVGVPFYFVVNKSSSPEEQEAAKAFLNYLVNTPLGQSYMTEKFGFIPAYKGVSSKGLKGVGADILAYSAEGKQIPWLFGNFPDGFSNEAANLLQAYIAGQFDWNTVLTRMDEAWQKLAK